MLRFRWLCQPLGRIKTRSLQKVKNKSANSLEENIDYQIPENFAQLRMMHQTVISQLYLVSARQRLAKTCAYEFE